jgi:Repeat of unknown function (DUF346)
MAWMGSVDGLFYLSQLSIPGTHDSLTFNASPVAQDQNTGFDIAAQLTAGIRWFDLRLCVNPLGDLVGYHGDNLLGEIPDTEFGNDIVSPTISFLTANPTECVIYAITNGGTKDYPMTLSERLGKYMSAYGGDWFFTENYLPVLNEVRGKIVIGVVSYGDDRDIPGLDLSGAPYNNWGTDGNGAPWTNTLILGENEGPVAFYTQTIYDDNWGNADPKIETDAIEGNIEAAAANTNRNNWFMTNTSRATSLFVSSKTFADGPLDSYQGYPANGYTQVALNQISLVPVTRDENQRTVGVVTSDFPDDTSGYIQAIIDRNPVLTGQGEALGEAGGGFNGAAAAVSWAANRLDIFVQGYDYQMYHKAWDGSWHPSETDWEPLGGVFPYRTAPAAVSWGANRLDVFAQHGPDRSLQHKWWDGSWHPSQTDWEPLGGSFYGWPPTAVSWGVGRLDVFDVGNDYGLYHKYWDGSWSDWEGPWEAAPGVGFNSVAAVSWGVGRLDVFGVGTDGRMYHKYYSDTSWSDWEGPWEAAPGVGFNSVAAVSWGVGRLDVIGADSGGNFYHKYCSDGSWNPDWVPLGGGGGFPTVPCAVSWGANRLDVFGLVRDPELELQMYHKAWDGSWTPWEFLGGNYASYPAAVSWGVGRLDVFAEGGDTLMYHKAWDGSWKP